MLAAAPFVLKPSGVYLMSYWAVTTIAGMAGVSGSNDGTNGAALFNSPPPDWPKRRLLLRQHRQHRLHF